MSGAALGVTHSRFESRSSARVNRERKQAGDGAVADSGSSRIGTGARSLLRCLAAVPNTPL